MLWPPSDPKSEKMYKQYSAVYTKMFNFRRITLLCLQKRLSKHKMTIFSECEGSIAPLAPWLRLCFGSPLRQFSAYATGLNDNEECFIPFKRDLSAYIRWTN